MSFPSLEGFNPGDSWARCRGACQATLQKADMLARAGRCSHSGDHTHLPSLEATLLSPTPSFSFPPLSSSLSIHLYLLSPIPSFSFLVSHLSFPPPTDPSLPLVLPPSVSGINTQQGVLGRERLTLGRISLARRELKVEHTPRQNNRLGG